MKQAITALAALLLTGSVSVAGTWESVLEHTPTDDEPSSKVSVSHCERGIIAICFGSRDTYGTSMKGTVVTMVCSKDECREVSYSTIDCYSTYAVQINFPVQWVKVQDVSGSGDGQRFVVECIP